MNRLPQRRKFELALMDIRRCLINPPTKDRADALRLAAYQIDRFIEEIACNRDKTKALIETALAVRESPGPGGTNAEEKLLNSLTATAYRCVVDLEDTPSLNVEKR